MMSNDALQARGRALEEAFFAQKNQELLKSFHERLEADERRAEINAVTGITDDATLDKLMELGIDASSITAVTLIPLVHVAWADRTMDAKERDAIMEAAKESGIQAGDTAHNLLQNWLHEQPGESLFSAWSDYVAVLKEAMDAAAFKILGDNICDRANKVAAAAGGILGLGKVSNAEKNVLDEIAQKLS